MKIVILDGYTANPGDLSWKALEEMGALTVYERTKPEETIDRAKDAADALNNNRLKAFCADVLTEEPPKADNPLLRCENAYITPHIAWASSEARVRLLDVAINNVRAFLDGKPQNVVTL